MTGLAQSVTLGGGQFCTNPGVFVVQKDADTEGVFSSLTQKLGQLPTPTLLTKGIQNAYIAGISHQRQSEGTSALTDFAGRCTTTTSFEN